MPTLIFFVILAPVVASQLCTESLLQNCTCSIAANAQLNISCNGTDIVNITKQLPPNTILYQYKAMELFVNLGSINFSHIPRLETLLIQDIGDYSTLSRKISPIIPKEGNMFGNLTNLRVLAININWEMERQLPDIFKGLSNLEKLDLSNTRLMNIDNLIVSLQGLRSNTNITELNLWNIKTIEHSAPQLEFELDKVLEPLSNSTLKVLNIGYNAFRFIKPGLLQYAPHLKRIIARNNVLLPVITSSLVTEICLHKSLVMADVSEQGFRPASIHPIGLKSFTLSALPSLKTVYEYPGSQGLISETEFLAFVGNHKKQLSHNQICQNQCDHADNITQLANSKIPDIVKEYIECFILLYDDTCNILSPPCQQVKEILTKHHELFCGVLVFFFRWHFDQIPCEYIPSFAELISPDCGACLVLPLLGNLKEFYVSGVNIYDYVLMFKEYRDRPICFHPNVSIEVLDLSNNHPHGWPELNKIFQTNIRGIENLKIFNCSQNAIDTLHANMSENFPNLQVIDASHNKIALTLSDQESFLGKIRSIKHVDFSYNEIRQVAEHLATMKNLQYFDVSHNMINQARLNISSMSRLQFVDLSYNQLTSIPESTFSQLNEVAMSNKSHNLSINIGSNNLICTCATKDFVEWVLYSHPPNLVFVNVKQYNCTNRYSDQVALHSVKMQTLYLECYESVIYGCVGAFCSVMLILIILAYKRRFYLRHKLYKCNKKLKKRTYNQQHHEYDAFICYDRADSDWVDYEAKRYLRQFKIVYGEEDIEFGQNVHEAVYQYIEQSHRSILVLSPNFVNSPNSLYHMRVVEEKLKFTGNDILIIVMLKPLSRVGLDRTLKELMEHRLCLEWKENNQDAQDFFWEQLMDAIGAPCEELYDAPCNDTTGLIQ